MERAGARFIEMRSIGVSLFVTEETLILMIVGAENLSTSHPPGGDKERIQSVFTYGASCFCA
jgi:hypothetical protein